MVTIELVGVPCVVCRCVDVAMVGMRVGAWALVGDVEGE